MSQLLQREREYYAGFALYVQKLRDSYIHPDYRSELNALNAAFAVIEYKKYFDFYQDVRDNMQTIYSINVGEVINNDLSDIT